MREERRCLNSSDMVEVCVKLSEGDSKALKVIFDILRNYSGGAVYIFNELGDMNIRGTQILIGYKCYCQENLEKFIKLVRAKDEKMIDFINCQYYLQGGRYKAVKNGANFNGCEFFNVEDIKGFNGGRGEGE